MTTTQLVTTGKFMAITLTGKPLMVNSDRSLVVIISKSGELPPATTSITEKELTPLTLKVPLGSENQLIWSTFQSDLEVLFGVSEKMEFQI